VILLSCDRWRGLQCPRLLLRECILRLIAIDRDEYRYDLAMTHLTIRRQHKVRVAKLFQPSQGDSFLRAFARFKPRGCQCHKEAAGVGWPFSPLATGRVRRHAVSGQVFPPDGQARHHSPPSPPCASASCWLLTTSLTRSSDGTSRSGSLRQGNPISVLVATST